MANQIKTDSKYDDFDFPTISPESKSGHPGHTTPEQDAQIYQLVGTYALSSMLVQERDC